MTEMNSRERMLEAMCLETPDRVPVMCQLSIGHYFLHSRIDPVEIWCDSLAFAEALVSLQERYQFDGILVNLPGRPSDWERHIKRREATAEGTILHWKNGNQTVFPKADNPSFIAADDHPRPVFDTTDPGELFYVEPWGLSGVQMKTGDEFEGGEGGDAFPDCQFNAVREVIARTGRKISVHGEVFSPWSQFMELFGYEQALLAVMDHPEKVSSCLERLAEGAGELGSRLAREGADAVLISSAFAGGGFISREHYARFVLPHERAVIDRVRSCSGVPVYTHTCGRIGDRIDLMLESGTGGIDTLDPPPLGNVDLAKAKEMVKGRAFIKGNIDAVNTLLKGSPAEIRKDVEYRITVGKEAGGYILSTACSVAPATPPGNIAMLVPLAAEFGQY